MFKKHEPALRAGTGASATGQPARRSFFFLLLALVLALAVSMAAFSGEAEAKKKKTKPFTQTRTVLQSGQTLVNANGADITGATSYTFSKTSKMRSLKKVTITATIFDGDTGPGSPQEPDHGDLTLRLDGVDTGIKLNGFRDNQTNTQTITGALDPGKATQILALLKQDGQLKATIKDADADDIDPTTTVGSNNKVTLPVVNTGQVPKFL
ncbi:MAG: hypothetical protein LC781_16325 [Actinobacteria bacterium]|nr:hypothetical protein [Actinomycetota bacterium]